MKLFWSFEDFSLLCSCAGNHEVVSAFLCIPHNNLVYLFTWGPTWPAPSIAQSPGSGLISSASVAGGPFFSCFFIPPPGPLFPLTILASLYLVKHDILFLYTSQLWHSPLFPRGKFLSGFLCPPFPSTVVSFLTRSLLAELAASGNPGPCALLSAVMLPSTCWLVALFPDPSILPSFLFPACSWWWGWSLSCWKEKEGRSKPLGCEGPFAPFPGFLYSLLPAPLLTSLVLQFSFLLSYKVSL